MANDAKFLNSFIESSANLTEPSKDRPDPIYLEKQAFAGAPTLQRQVFSNHVSVSAEEHPVSSAVPETTSPLVPSLPVSKQKLSWMQGDVPPGYKAAQSCDNCIYGNDCYDGYACSKHQFPCSRHYTCDDFKSYRQQLEEEEEEKAEEVLAALTFSNPDVTSPTESRPSVGVTSEEPPQTLADPSFNDSTVKQLYEQYEDVIRWFANGELATKVLVLTSQRFANRSEYSDAFLDFQYRKAYKKHYGSLEDAYITKD